MPRVKSIAKCTCNSSTGILSALMTLMAFTNDWESWGNIVGMITILLLYIFSLHSVCFLQFICFSLVDCTVAMPETCGETFRNASRSFCLPLACKKCCYILMLICTINAIRPNGLNWWSVQNHITGLFSLRSITDSGQKNLNSEVYGGAVGPYRSIGLSY